MGTCTNATDGICNVGDQFDGGEVHVKGIDATAGYTFGDIEKTGFAVPLSLVYTLSDAKFRSSFASGYEQWGEM